MTYYKLKPQYDNIRYNNIIGKTNKHKCSGFLIANELLTESELTQTGLPSKFFTILEIDPCRTFVMFGARFEM